MEDKVPVQIMVAPFHQEKYNIKRDSQSLHIPDLPVCSMRFLSMLGRALFGISATAEACATRFGIMVGLSFWQLLHIR
jgi:hypothetical protein